jgi:hypothetical protein
MAQTTVNGITVYSPQPTGDAGLAIDDNFREIASRIPLASGPLPRYSVTASINAKSTGDTNVYTLPGGYIWSIDSIDIICSAVSGSGNPPTMRFGLSTDTDQFGQLSIDAVALNEKVTLRNIGANGIASTNILSAGVATASTYTTHSLLVTFNLTGVEV